MTDDIKLTMLGISILTCKIRLKFETDDFKVLVLAIFVSSFFWSSLQPQTKRFGMSQWMIKSSSRHLNNFYSLLATLAPLLTKSWTYFIIPLAPVLRLVLNTDRQAILINQMKD